MVRRRLIMKIGDKVRKKTDVQGRYATIEKVDIRVRHGYTDTRYKAVYPDGELLIFRGCQIGKTIQRMEGSQQLSIFDYLKAKGEQ